MIAIRRVPIKMDCRAS